MQGVLHQIVQADILEGLKLQSIASQVVSGGGRGAVQSCRCQLSSLPQQAALPHRPTGAPCTSLESDWLAPTHPFHPVPCQPSTLPAQRLATSALPSWPSYLALHVRLGRLRACPHGKRFVVIVVAAWAAVEHMGACSVCGWFRV